MRIISELNGFLYGLAEASDMDDMAGLLAEVFSRFEPMTLAAGMPYREVHDLVMLFGSQAVADGLSVIARPGPGGSLVGATLVRDFANLLPDGLDQAAPHFGPVGCLLDGLDDRYRETTSVLSGQIMHLFMGGVYPGYGGRGIAQNMLELLLQNGTGKGYRLAVTEATGRVSQHILHNHGFVERFRTGYLEFVHDGTRVFESIPEEEACILMERVL